MRGPGVPPAARFSWPPLLPVWRTQAASGGNPREGPGEEALAAKKIPTLAQQDRGQEEAGQGKGWRRTPGVACLRVQSRPPPSFRETSPAGHYRWILYQLSHQGSPTLEAQALRRGAGISPRVLWGAPRVAHLTRVQPSPRGVTLHSLSIPHLHLLQPWPTSRDTYPQKPRLGAGSGHCRRLSPRPQPSPPTLSPSTHSCPLSGPVL